MQANAEPLIPRNIGGIATDSIPVLEPGDGGLKHRQVLREVKDRMSSVAFRHNTTRVIHCGELKRDEHCGRAFRTWDALRGHLISYHRVDSREIPL